MNNKLPNFIRRKQIIGLAILAFFIVLIKLFHFYYQNINKTESPKVDFVAVNSENISIPLTEFNPNDLDEKQWQNLGFSEKQVKTILNYKNVVGGAFVSKEQLKKCYAISEEKFKEIEPYILLPETNSERGNKHYEIHKYEKKSLNISQKVNPDLLSLNDWIKIGFSEKQANAIINYKEYLGGSFISKEKFKECFVISEEYYQKLAPYLLLPEKIPENSTPQKSFTKQEKTKIAYQDFDPNELTAEGWQKLGFSEKQANVIINYKNKYLKGNFKSLEDIEKCFVISAEKFAEMKPFIKIKSHNLPATESSKIENSHNEKVAVVKTDFSKIDLNQITYNQLVEFGFNEKTARSFLGFRKNLGGFVNKNQIYETYGIERDLAEKLASITLLNTSNVAKYTLLDAPESWLKTHPYFKYSADKIIYFRLSNDNEKKIWKSINVKPEYENKMKLYLK